jgi:outer membrane murein-binding lipoprotein Lpp
MSVMMRRAWLPGLAATLLLPACLPIWRAGAVAEAEAEERLVMGVASLAAGDWAAGGEELAGVYTYWADRALGRQALLTLAAGALDPRNPERRPALTVELAGRYLTHAEAPYWSVPIAEALYLVALELADAVPAPAGEPPLLLALAGAPATTPLAERRERAEAFRVVRRDAVRLAELPTLTGPTVAARLQQAESATAGLAARVDELEQRASSAERELAARERELAATRQELDRIRRTLRP